MIRYTYDDKGNAVPAPEKPAAEPYPHRGAFTSAYTVGDRVSATYDIRSAPRRAGVVWGVLFHEAVGGDTVAYKIKMDDTGQFETWASGYVVPYVTVRPVHVIESVASAVLGDAARKGYNLMNPDDMARWKADTEAGTITIEPVRDYNACSHFVLYGQSPMSDITDEARTSVFLEAMLDSPQMMVDTGAITEADVAEAWTRIASVATRVGVSPYHKEGASESLRVADETAVALVELIRQAEWSGGDDPCCPWCGRGKGWDRFGWSTHDPDCPVARVLYPSP